MPDKLPKGWAKTTLGDISVLSRARALPMEDLGLPYVGMEHVEAQTMKLLGHGEAKGLKSSSVRFNQGDVLYGKMRPYLNKVWLAEFDGLCSAEFLVFSRVEGLNNKFLAYRLNSHDFVTFANRHVSGDRPRVDYDKLARFPVMLPPSREQDRIVERLDALLSRVTAGEVAARRALDRLQRYRAAVLHAAVTGELTSEWRKSHLPEETGVQLVERLLSERRARWEEAELKRLHDTGKPPKDNNWNKRYPKPQEPITSELPAVPMTWKWASADQLTDANRAITYGIVKLGSNVARGVPVLRSSNVRRLELDLDNVKRVSRNVADEYKRTYLKGGEVLMTVRGTLGGVVVVPSDCTGHNISREVAMLALLVPESARAVALFIASDFLQQWLNERAKGVAYTGINIETLHGLPLPVPPLEEQQQITSEVERRLKRAAELEAVVKRQFARAGAMQQSLLREAFSGNLLPQDPSDENAASLLERIKAEQIRLAAEGKVARRRIPKSPKGEGIVMQSIPSAETLKEAWLKIGKKPDAKRLFAAADFSPEQVVSFYELLRSDSQIREAFQSTQKRKPQTSPRVLHATSSPGELMKPGRFRLVALWLENFKNLKNYEVSFGPGHGLDVVLGWNGTGKSNLFEALVIIFRDLHYWWEKNKWPTEPMAGYRLRYEIEDQVVEVNWNPSQMKRPEVTKTAIPHHKGAELEFRPVKREDVPLPKFVFGYYSGPTNRLADHFWPMKRDHYERLRKANSDDPTTLAKLLEQRRFFCAEASHAKYVLLAFSYKEDAKIWRFLDDRLRIVGFESALFVVRKPRWAKGKPDEFWGATGIMRRVMEKLKRYAIAPMVLTQKVADGYRLPSEELYYFYLPDLASLHAFAAEYADARSFFLALESTDFSELIHDVRIQVRVKAANNEESLVTFRELSEGEQQLLMVLGLMRFTKSHQSLILLDEPDTHLNPHWSVQYLKDLASVVSDDNDPGPEQQTSQLLMATHDPLVIASLFKDQVHLLKRDRDSLHCYWQQASENPRGLGYTGILLSDMFGFRSDLDEETLALLDRQVQLAGKREKLTRAEKDELTNLNEQIEMLGFKTTSSDPYYRAFIEALARRQDTLALIQKPVQTKEERDAIRQTADEILTRLAQKHADHL